MFIINLTYIKDLKYVDEYLQEHTQCLDEQYQAGIFLISGRKKPRTGGIIVANAIVIHLALGVLKKDSRAS